MVYHINGEPLRAGIFTVDEPPRRLSTMQIRALDNMARFNRPWVPGISFPATLFQIIQDACNQCNVTLGTLEFDNHDYVVEQKPEGDDITNHHIIAWVAELAGSNAWIDEFGRLRLSWYGDNQIGNFEISPHNMMSYDEIAEADIEITGIAYRTEEIDYILGTDEYALLIEDNPLLQNNFEAVLTVLYNKIGGFKYRPYRLEVVGYPHVWPGDIITKLIDIEGNELTSIVTNHTYRLNGNSKLAARGETETVRGYATGAPFTAAQKRVLQSVAKVEAERQTSKLEQTMLDFNQLMTNALGYYETYHTLPSGAKIRYIHDKPVLEESTNIYKYSAEGFGWTDQGWQGGNPVWQGIDAAGNIIAKTLSVIGIKTKWIDVDDLSAIAGRFSELEAGDENEGGKITLRSGYMAIEGYDPAGMIWRSANVSTAGYRFEAQGLSTHRHAEMYAENTFSLFSMGYSITPGNPEPKTTLWTGDISDWRDGIIPRQWDNRFFEAVLHCVYDFLLDIGGDYGLGIKAAQVKIGAPVLADRLVIGQGADAPTEVLHVAGNAQVDGSIYLPHAAGDRVRINTTTAAGRQWFYIFSTGTTINNAGCYMSMYGMEDSGFPGQIVFGNNGNPTLRMYSDNNVRFYGDVQIDGAITNATITSSTVNISASRLTSGTIPLARIPTYQKIKSRKHIQR